MPKNKYLKQDSKGRFYNSRYFNKREIDSLRYKDKEISVKTIIPEKKTYQYRVKDKNGKTRIKTETIIEYKDESGKKVSKAQFTRYEQRLKANSEVQKEKFVKGLIEDKAKSTTVLMLRKCFEYIYNDFEDGKDVFFEGSRIKNILDLDRVFSEIRKLLNSTEYPEFCIRVKYISGKINYIISVTKKIQ